MRALPFSFLLDARRLALAVPLAGLVGCTTNSIEIDTDGSTSEADTGASATDASATQATMTTGIDPDSGSGSDGGPPEPTQRAVDILFVIDNSGSMSEEQANLVSGLEGLLSVLDGAAPPVDYRIAVTTTDNGNPWCQASGPEGGSFVATSCRSRPNEFIFNGAIEINAFDEACGNTCTLETLQNAEPWVDVERTTGTTNVGSDTVIDTLRCMLPQGIAGCGFEQPLESMWKGIERMSTAGDMAFGFRRPGALLAVMIVTDEVDCSHDSAAESMFLPEGNRVFWSDPDAFAPTSAVCWNAGVACSGSNCTAVNLDLDGNQLPDSNADDAVLRPLSRYLEQLQSEGAYVAAINGVTADGTVVYQDSRLDPQYQNDFGIGPGCQSEDGPAVPPVRVHELIQAVSGPGHEHSICNAGFGDALAAFGQGIVGQLP